MLNIGSQCHVVLLFVRQLFCAVVVMMAGCLCMSEKLHVIRWAEVPTVFSTLYDKWLCQAYGSHCRDCVCLDEHANIIHRVGANAWRQEMSWKWYSTVSILQLVCIQLCDEQYIEHTGTMPLESQCDASLCHVMHGQLATWGCKLVHVVQQWMIAID